MLFALLDYIDYQKRRGRFSRDYRHSIMGGAFEGSLPSKCLNDLRAGDVLFVETFNSFISWLVMYLTRSEISHVAFYLGNRQISHATLAGVIIEPVENLFDSNTRILPCIWPMPDKTRLEIERYVREHYAGAHYGLGTAALKGVRITLGRDWKYFRWSFPFDFGLTLLLLDLPLYFVFGYPVLTWLLVIYLSAISVNYFFWRTRPLPFSEKTGKPNELLEFLWSQGASFGFDIFSVRQQREKLKRSN